MCSSGSHAVRQARKMADREEIWHQDLKSPDHRETLLDRKFRLMKVAARKGDDGRWYAAQVLGKRWQTAGSHASKR